MVNFKRRASRSLVTIIFLTMFQSVVAVNLAPVASAATFGSTACASDFSNTANVVEVTLANYCVFKITSGTTTWTPLSGIQSLYVLAIGGGGGGGNNAGGGGAGGAVAYGKYTVGATTSVSISVGGGGAGGNYASGTNDGTTLMDGQTGGNTTVTADVGVMTLTAAGGNGGQTHWNTNYCGGSGSPTLNVTGGTVSSSGAYTALGNSTGASGGGWAGNGANAGAGSAGISNSITGVAVSYAAGGGGGAWNATAGAGGTGGGGGGGGSGVVGTAGTANTGSGGGGGGDGCANGGAGGSGIVILKWIPTPVIATPSNASCLVNRTASFTTTMTSSTSLTVSYKWQISTNSGVSYADVTGGTGSTSLSYTTAANDSTTAGNMYRVSTTYADTNISTLGYSAGATLSLTYPPGSDTDTALTFNGSSQYARAADAASLDISDSITIEAWVYQTASITGSWNMVVNKETSYELGTVNGTWWYGLNGTSSWTGVNTGIPLTLNSWQHVAMTRAAGTNSVKFYLNGNLVFTGSADGLGTGLIANSVYTLTVSGRDNGNNSIGAYFQGQIDELRIFAADRTASQIASDMNTYGPINSPSLRLYYDFNEGSGTKLYNRVSGALAESDLTIYNSPTWSDIKAVDTSTASAYTIVEFDRSYLTSVGGWKVPDNVTALSALIVAGGGGGGFNSGGGGAGGGVLYQPRISPTGYQTVIVGMGGRGAYSVTDTSTSGFSSTLGSSTAAGGSAGGNYPSSQAGGAAIVTASNTSGAGGAGSTGSTISGTAGQAGVTSTISGTSQTYAGGGGGGGWAGSTGGGVGGSGGGGAGGVTNSQAGKKGTANTGGGGGAGSSSTVDSGAGGSGIIIVRWITALLPAYTKPTNAYLNAGMTETFTTNVAQDSATAILTRNFKWESTTPTANGVYTLIKQGTGAANAAFSWIPTDTATSGSGYLYRLTVTDSDTAGLFITDSSTAYAVINRALSVVGTSTITKRINLSRNETFTITLGTSTYRPTLSPVIPGITLDTSTAGLAVIKIADTTTVGTYYETLTVTDSVSARVVTPLIIKVAAPPTLLNSGEIVSDGMVLNLDVGNSASLIADSGTVTTSLTWKDLSGSKADATTGPGVNTGGGTSTSCSAPAYTSDNGGALQFSGNSNNCYYASGAKSQGLENSFTIEAWFKTTAALSSNVGLVSQTSPGINAPYTFVISTTTGSSLYFGYWDNTIANNKFTSCGYTPVIGTWTHISGTYDGSNLALYVNGQLQCSTAASSYVTSGLANNYGLIIGKTGSGGSTSSFPGYISTVRLYNKPLTGAQVLSNFNATKSRFDNTNISFITPSKKYGTSLLDSFTATSGHDTKTVTFTVGDRAGVDWDTTTVVNRVNLTLQESLTVGTYYDTATVTDSLGQSTYLPITMKVTVADSITVTSSPSVTVVYSGSAPATLPVTRVTGLVGFDTATTVNSYTSAGGSTCATGGTCSIGDIGPGGGYVFYVSATVIDSATGISDGGTYLEVAPKGWSTPGSEYQGQWAAASTSITGTSRTLGTGAENTRKIVAALGSTANLAKVTADLTYGGKSDWFFPSTDEVKAMYTNLYSASLGDFSALNYWGSTQDDLNSQSARADTYWFGAGATYSPTDKLNNFYLRPIRAFSPSSTTTTTTPTDVDTYTVTGSTPTFTVGSLSNYAGVMYETSTLKITQAYQNKLTINYYGAVAGRPFTIITTGGSGTGAVTETVTAGSNATNCQVSNHVLTNSNSSIEQKYCRVIITKAASRNYFVESLTADVYFMVYISNQPTGQVGSGSTIALNGKTSLTIDDSSTVRVPRISGFSKSGTTLTINGEGFGSSPVTITFERYVNAATQPTPTLGGTVITVTIPGSAVSGPVLVITAGGRDSIDWLDLP